MAKDIEAALREAIARGGAMIVVGTGVSIGASWDPATRKPHPQASWVGLLQHGLEWLKTHHLITAPKADALHTLLTDSPQTQDFITVAQAVVRGMGGADSPHFEEWLKQTIGTIRAWDVQVIEALHALREHGNFLATTNYDELLLDDAGKLTPITWKHSDEIIGALQKKETDKVIFLHGHWRQPSSVILDWSSYDQIARDSQYREDLAIVWHATTWVFVGAGKDGLGDPDFGLLLEKYGRRARQTGLWDYCLVLKNDLRDFQAHFDQLGLNIRAVPYGDNHGALPAFLRSLLPVVIAPTPTIPATTLSVTPPPTSNPNPIPKPPAFYAEPDYIGSHQFVGRESQLQDLGDWAKAADPTNLLLFEAIGGNGKSMLTWEWATKHAVQDRTDWQGRFWYSFYERGAIMADFCQHALAYLTGRPLQEFRKMKTTEMMQPLLRELHAKPWLLVLDGLERVLVAYHRFDAAEVPDEEANNPTDKIVNRDPCTAIRDEDNDLLRALAAAKPSKILITSRLTPKALLNAAGQPIPGAKRLPLPGLRPADAEQLLRSCEIRGDSAAIQAYLSENCDNHPLVIGILGGLIRNYLPDRGNFDAWEADPDGGRQLNLAELDLIQRRNHILRAAITALPEKSAQLLSTLALLSESVDYETLKAFNPHLSPQPEKVEKPAPPEEDWDWYEDLSETDRGMRQQRYEAEFGLWKANEVESKARLSSITYRVAPKRLTETVTDLERRGLLQYDGATKRYDLHPVVRGVAAGGMREEDKQRYGQQVVDHFSSQSYNPYEDAETLDELSAGLHVIRTLLKLGHLQEAADASMGGFSRALVFNLEAYSLMLSLLRPFFFRGISMMNANCCDKIFFGFRNFCRCRRLGGFAHGTSVRDLGDELSYTHFCSDQLAWVLVWLPRGAFSTQGV